MAIIFVSVSALLQFASAWLALRLIPLTKGRWGMAWVFVSSAIFLMALRRCISIYRLLSAPDTGKFDLTAELFAFTVSVLMFAGFLRLRDMFIEMGQKTSLDLKAMNEALKEAALKSENERARAESIIASLGDGLIIQDKNYRVIYQNKLQKDKIGDKTGELCYKAFMGLDSVCPDCPVEKSFKDGKVHRTVHSSDYGGGVRYFELTASPLFDSSGRITAGIKIVRDITEHRRAIDDLTRSKTLLAKAQRLARMGSWERELATGRMTWSDEMFDIFGLDPASGPPSFEGLLSMIHPEDRENLRETVGCAIAERAGYTIEYRIIKPDGSERNILAEGMVTTDESGTPSVIFGIAKDITEKKRAEIELSRYRENLEELVDIRTAELKEAYKNLEAEAEARRKMEDGRRGHKSAEARIVGHFGGRHSA